MADGIFDDIFTAPGVDQGDNKPPSNEDGAPPETPSVNEDTKKLQAEIAQLKAQNKKMSEMISKSESSQEILGRLQSVFAPQGESQDDIDNRMVREFDDNPARLIKEHEALKKKFDELNGKLHANNIERAADKAIEAINKEYEIDWDGGEGHKIAKELDKLSPKLRSENPVAAVKTAMKLAGVGKKREAIPFIEGGSFNIPSSVRKKAVDKFADDTRKGILSQRTKKGSIEELLK